MTEYFDEGEAYSVERLFKIIVIGEIACGKTSIIKRYVHNIFSDSYKSTIGVDFALKVLDFGDNTLVRLQLWDIAGQERYGNMTRVYFKDAVGAFLVFDSTRAETLDAVLKWKRDVDNKVFQPNGDPIPVMLLANKADMVDEMLDQVKNTEFMNEYCKKNGFIGWRLTSAKDNTNIHEAATTLVDEIMKRDIRDLGENSDEDEDENGKDIVLVDDGEDSVETSTKHKQSNQVCCGS